MNIGQHNRLMAIVFGNTKHFKHVMRDDEIKTMTMLENSCPLTRQPVCGRCEQLALWHHGEFNEPVGICKKCGTITKNPVTYATYLASGFDIDPTGLTAKEALRQRKRIVDNYVPDYGRH